MTLEENSKLAEKLVESFTGIVEALKSSHDVIGIALKDIADLKDRVTHLEKMMGLKN